MKSRAQFKVLGSNFFLFLIPALFILFSSCGYWKMDPPPDADKPFLTNNNTCYLATAANMLAGAGYGTGTTVQARADDIYNDLTSQFGTTQGGWTDAAISWWLSSSNNTWPNNPYTVVTVNGNKNPKNPWANTNGARFIGNELRRCQFLGLSISWPTDQSGVIGSGGHAITCWGDNFGEETLPVNPTEVVVTDSDDDTGGDVQEYEYDDYTSPNPGGPNEGNGWYFDYDNNHPYIKHIITLCPTDDPSDNKLTQKVVGSYKIHQTKETPATDLHYRVSTDVEILSYKTTLDWETENTPSIMEGQPQREITVDWDLSDKPVPQCTWVTITTEFVLPFWNAINYNDVNFTYPDGSADKAAPTINWRVETPTIDSPESIPNVTGGYVVGRFTIFSLEKESEVGEYRFIHQYSFNQSPEMHVFFLIGENGYAAINLLFGHSYGYLDADSLWKFEDWMTEIPEFIELGEEPIEIEINWEGRLPYPEGEDITQRIPEIK